MITKRVKVYIAGPDVFRPDPVAVGDHLKRLTRQYGFHPLYPLDNELPVDHPDPSLGIFEKNTRMIEQANVVIANLNPFRGHEPDSGTVLEVGIAKTLKKRVVGYMSQSTPMVDRVLGGNGRISSRERPVDSDGLAIENFGHPLNLMLMHSLDHLVIGDFEDALRYLHTNRRADINVKQLRLQLGMNQSDFWSPIGITQSAGSRYEGTRLIPRPVRELLRLVYIEQIDLAEINSEDMMILSYLKEFEPDRFTDLLGRSRSQRTE